MRSIGRCLICWRLLCSNPISELDHLRSGLCSIMPTRPRETVFCELFRHPEILAVRFWSSIDPGMDRCSRIISRTSSTYVCFSISDSAQTPSSLQLFAIHRHRAHCSCSQSTDTELTAVVRNPQTLLQLNGRLSSEQEDE